MFFPLRHDRPLRATPWLTMSLIVINVAVFVLTIPQLNAAYAFQMDAAARGADITRQEWWAQFPVLQYHLWPLRDGFHGWQLFSAAFLHADFWHLAGNMLFLWIFGGAVEDRLGKLGFIAFYAAGAAAAGGLYLATGPAGPMLGASGAIMALAGAFLVLFPQVRIRIVYWIFLVGAIDLPALWVLLAYFGMDVFFFLAGHGHSAGGGTAYAAHIGGFAFGFTTATLLLATRLLAREPQWDLFAMLQHRRRREKFKSLARRDGAPWMAAPTGKVFRPATADAPPPLPPAIVTARDLVARQPDLALAAETYAGLLAIDPAQVFHEDLQANLAANLMQSGRHGPAAQAYRLLLKHYPRRADRASTQLLLALLCKRYLNLPDEAQVLLKEALPKLEGAEKAMAEGMLGA